MSAETLTTVNDEPLQHVADFANPMVVMGRFYQHIVKIKRWIGNGTLADQVSAQLRLSRAPSQQEMAEAVSLQLQRWIEQVRLKIKKVLTERECANVEEALYVMTVLADELFIMELDWPGQECWESVLLEERLFQSSYAGEEFFLGVKRLLHKRTLEPQQQQLAAVYLLALRLGFSGCYRDDQERLAHYREQLFKRISVTQSDDQQPLYAQAYAHVLASREEQRLAPLAKWYRYLAIGTIAYLLVSYVVWISTKGYWI